MAMRSNLDLYQTYSRIWKELQHIGTNPSERGDSLQKSCKLRWQMMTVSEREQTPSDQRPEVLFG